MPRSLLAERGGSIQGRHPSGSWCWGSGWAPDLVTTKGAGRGARGLRGPGPLGGRGIPGPRGLSQDVYTLCPEAWEGNGGQDEPAREGWGFPVEAQEAQHSCIWAGPGCWLTGMGHLNGLTLSRCSRPVPLGPTCRHSSNLQVFRGKNGIFSEHAQNFFLDIVPTRSSVVLWPLCWCHPSVKSTGGCEYCTIYIGDLAILRFGTPGCPIGTRPLRLLIIFLMLRFNWKSCV